MEEKSLKTSVWQRVVILVIAFLLLGSTVLAYLFIVMSGNKSSSSAQNEALISELTTQYDAKSAELTEAIKPLSDKYFATLKGYKSEVKAYNAATADAAILEKKDLKVGTGKTLAEGDTDYLAYYIGWCADGSIFSSSFDNNDNPTALSAPFDPSSTIEGWKQGVVGMKIGGVRQLTISGKLAYADTQEICGGYNSPLKFVVLAIDNDEKISKLLEELNNIWLQLYMAYYGSQI